MTMTSRFTCFRSTVRMAADPVLPLQTRAHHPRVGDANRTALMASSSTMVSGRLSSTTTQSQLLPINVMRRLCESPRPRPQASRLTARMTTSLMPFSHRATLQVPWPLPLAPKVMARRLASRQPAIPSRPTPTTSSATSRALTSRKCSIIRPSSKAITRIRVPPIPLLHSTMATEQGTV